MTKEVVMLANVFDADRTLLAAGSTVTVDDAVAYDLVGTGRARWSSAPVNTPTLSESVPVVYASPAAVSASSPFVPSGVQLADPTTRLIYGQSDGVGGYESLLGGEYVSVSVAGASGGVVEI